MREVPVYEQQAHQRAADNEESYWNEMARAAVLQKDYWKLKMRPALMLPTRLFLDGDQWCVLYGENRQDGVASFGRSPREAFAEFDEAWKRRLPEKAEAEAEAEPPWELPRALGNDGHDCPDEIRNSMGTCPACWYPWVAAF